VNSACWRNIARFRRDKGLSSTKSRLHDMPAQNKPRLENKQQKVQLAH
jgi:hypothetical protein